MRIRKNAKVSALLYTNTDLSNASNDCFLQKNLCQLNQSPWDIITFPSPDSSSSLHQFDDNEVYYNVNPTGNGSSIDALGAFESLVSVNTSNAENYNLDDQKTNYGEILGFQEGEASEVHEETVLCQKRDEKGCHCERMARIGNTMCDHHILELQNGAVWTAKKSRPINRPKAPGSRPRQSKKPAPTNPYEFYYYSGFGPSWGKKRGGSGSNAHNEAIQGKEVSLTDNIMVVVKEEETFEPEMNKGRPMKMESAYMEDDDDKNNKGTIRLNGKKRGRKPVKARSLKSLM